MSSSNVCHGNGPEPADDDLSSKEAVGNLFDGLPVGRLNDEVFTTLFQTPGLKVERIVSTGQATPEGTWYDQAWAEWVLLLQGRAWLRFEDQPAAQQLMPGDFVLIPAHRRHRVEATDLSIPTVWLAIHAAP